MSTDSKWSKQEACFAHVTQSWLAVNHNTSITSGEKFQCSKCIALARGLGSCQSNLCNSRGYEQLQKFKDSLKDCFENVNIKNFSRVYTKKVFDLTHCERKLVYPQQDRQVCVVKIQVGQETLIRL